MVPNTRQALPCEQYLTLLGAAICAFNANNAFIIENILRLNHSNYDWSKLIDLTSGVLLGPVEQTITKKSGQGISTLFAHLVNKRNRIVHSFQITSGLEQILATKDRAGVQFHIDSDYLQEFIEENEQLAILLNRLRGF